MSEAFVALLRKYAFNQAHSTTYLVWKMIVNGPEIYVSNIQTVSDSRTASTLLEVTQQQGVANVSQGTAAVTLKKSAIFKAVVN